MKKAKLLKNCLGMDKSISQVLLAMLLDPKPKLEGGNRAEMSTMGSTDTQTDSSMLEVTLYWFGYCFVAESRAYAKVLTRTD